MRVILYTGKGGVGKTSVAAATALRAAELGYRTVVMSTDSAHSLGDSFDIELGPNPVAVADGLWGQEVDPLKELERHWSSVRNWLAAVMRWQGVDDVLADEMAVAPGMEELVGLLYVNRYSSSGEYDVLIVDCAPTGETLRLLSFPESVRWFLRRVLPIERRVAGAIGPLARGLLKIPVPETRVFDSVQDLLSQAERVKRTLEDPAVSTVRLVVNPEKMVIKEAQRTFTYLNLFGYTTDLVVCNRVIPQEVEDPYFSAWRESQARYLRMVDEGFSPVPVLRAPLLSHEVVGLDALREMAQAVFGDRDPVQRFYHGQVHRVSREGKGRVMRVYLPFLDGKAVSVVQHGDELVIQAGQHRRNIVLPRTLAGLAVSEAVMEGTELKVSFESEGGSGDRR